VAALGGQDLNGETRPASGCYDLRAKGILSQAQAESRTITDLIKVAETYALLAAAEALQFSLGQDWPTGPLPTPVPPRSIGRPTVSTSHSDSSRYAYAESGTAPSPPTPS
jgi:hypothetical protein